MIENALTVQIFLKIYFIILVYPNTMTLESVFLRGITGMFKLLQLFNSENFTELCNLGRFFILAMKRRNCLQNIN